jgi:hypothetical protein
MATLKETIAQGASGLLSENGNRWRLCYDTHVGQFYVEHVVDGVKSNNYQPPLLTNKYDAASWDGPGADGIAEAKARLLERANS